MFEENEIKRVRLIEDLLVGSPITPDLQNLIKYKDLFGATESEETSKKVSKELSIEHTSTNLKLKYKKEKHSDHFSLEVDKEALTKITEIVLPPDTARNYKTTRITILLPLSASQINTTENTLNDFETNWKHYHIDGFSELPKELKAPYCLRLYSAFNLLRHANIKTTKDKPSTFISLIKTCDISKYFYILNANKCKEIKAKHKCATNKRKYEKYTDLQEHEYAEAISSRASIQDIKNKDNYYFFINPKEKETTNNKESEPLSNIAKNLIAPNSQPLSQRYVKVNLESDTYSNLNRGEADRQRMLQGFAYSLALFSGKIITIELPLAAYISKDIHANENKDKKESGAYHIIDQPCIICPKQIAGMLMDLKKHHQRLDTLLGINQNEYKQETNFSIQNIILNSVYTIHLLVNHTKMKSEELNKLMEIIGHFKSGSEPEELIKILKVTGMKFFDENYIDDVKPRKSVDLPITHPYLICPQ